MQTDRIGLLAMDVLQGAEDARSDRKFIKSQVEKRRRDRINRSLEHLRAMLRQEPQQMGGTQHRVEKAEILEHTVLFLQNTARGDKAGAGGGAGGGGGGQKHSFQDGFSTCLQRAAQFLGPEGKGLRLGAALDTYFAARFASSDSDSAGVHGGTEACSASGSLPYAKSILQMLRQKSKRRRCTRASGATTSVHPYHLPVQQGFPTALQEPLRKNELEIRAESQASKQSPSQSHPASQTLWRPWP